MRNSRWHMVCVSQSGEKEWQLFDVKADPGEKRDVAAQHPEVVKVLGGAALAIALGQVEKMLIQFGIALAIFSLTISSIAFSSSGVNITYWSLANS